MKRIMCRILVRVMTCKTEEYLDNKNHSCKKRLIGKFVLTCENEINIKNRTCCYFDDIIKIEDFDFDNIFFDSKSYVIILIYHTQNFDWCKIIAY